MVVPLTVYQWIYYYSYWSDFSHSIDESRWAQVNNVFAADDATHGPTLGCDCLQKAVFIDDTEARCQKWMALKGSLTERTRLNFPVHGDTTWVFDLPKMEISWDCPWMYLKRLTVGFYWQKLGKQQNWKGEKQWDLTGQNWGSSMIFLATKGKRWKKKKSGKQWVLLAQMA